MAAIKWQVWSWSPSTGGWTVVDAFPEDLAKDVADRMNKSAAEFEVKGAKFLALPPGEQPDMSMVPGAAIEPHCNHDPAAVTNGVCECGVIVEPSPAQAAADSGALPLHEFVARQSDDPVKTDLELIHEPCGEHLCDVEASDELSVLVMMARDHRCGGTQ